MKNLFYISFLFLVFSCGSEANSDSVSDKKTAQPAATEQTPTISETENSSKANEDATKILAKNDAKKEGTPVKTSAKGAATNISSKPKVEKTNSTSDAKNEAEAKAEIETQKARAMAEKMRLEEEMKKAEEGKKAQEIAAAKLKKEMEEKAAAEKAKLAQQDGDPSGSNNEKPTVEGGLHDEFDALLRNHVSLAGKVNYQGFKNEEGKLDAYLKKLEKTNVEKSWSRNKELAFWINAYNANTIKLILKNYPLKSIMDLNNGKPWDVKWIKIDQRTLSLNNIENDIIRPKFNEPRIHFAVNCAAKSCPPLLNKAWTESNLNTNLERQAKSFINNSSYNSITSGEAEVSKIFDWYGKDFGDLKAYLNKYANTQIASGTSINFKSYNWDLNN